MSAYSDFVLSLNPFAAYRESDAAGAASLLDFSGNGRHAAFTVGTSSPGPSLLEGDPDDGAQRVNGDRLAMLTDTAWLDSITLGSYTTVVWFSTTASGGVRRLCGRNRPEGGSDTGASQSLILTGPAAAGTGVYFYSGSNRDVNAVSTIGYDFADGRPHMVAGRRDARSSPATISLFLNGELFAERSEVVAPTPGLGYGFGILGDAQGTGSYADERWVGDHDETAIFPLLTNEEIRRLFCLGIPSRCGGWKIGQVAL